MRRAFLLVVYELFYGSTSLLLCRAFGNVFYGTFAPFQKTKSTGGQVQEDDLCGYVLLFPARFWFSITELHLQLITTGRPSFRRADDVWRSSGIEVPDGRLLSFRGLPKGPYNEASMRVELPRASNNSSRPTAPV